VRLPRPEGPAAEYLLDRGAALDWISAWDGLTPLDAADRSEAAELAAWLRRQGAKRASEVSGPADVPVDG
jgi:hypothetical protein